MSPEPDPPPAARRSLLSRPRATVTAIVAVVVLVLLGALLLTGVIGGGGDPASAESREVSVSELRDFGGSGGRTVYWVGELPGRRLELTQAEGSAWVRYLSDDAAIGDRRPAFTTVGTYPFASALREVRRRSRARGMVSRPVPDGGLATWSARRPTSVYLAYPDSNVLVEVYDPDAVRARELAISGEVDPVR